jgi:tetratricopeptide (TPR) repeat protein
MDAVLDFINNQAWIKPLLILGAIVLVPYIIYHILKSAKISAFQDKSFFEAMVFLFFKKGYMLRLASKQVKQNMFLKAGKIYEDVGEYRKAIAVYEEGQEFDAMGELLEKQNKETDAIEVYKRCGNADALVRLFLKRKNIEAAGTVLENNNQFQEAAELYYNNERYEKAAQIYEKKGFYKKAAYIYEKAGNLKKAAINFEKWFSATSESSFGFQTNKQLEQYLL